jgi:hypothetical protein
LEKPIVHADHLCVEISCAAAGLRGSAEMEDNVRHQLAMLHVTDCNKHAAASRIGFALHRGVVPARDHRRPRINRMP